MKSSDLTPCAQCGERVTGHNKPTIFYEVTVKPVADIAKVAEDPELTSKFLVCLECYTTRQDAALSWLCEQANKLQQAEEKA